MDKQDKRINLCFTTCTALKLSINLNKKKQENLEEINLKIQLLKITQKLTIQVASNNSASKNLGLSLRVFHPINRLLFDNL